MMVDDALADMLEHVAAAHLSRSSCRPLRRRLGRPGVERLDPVLDRAALVLADLVELVQGLARLEQAAPVVEAAVGREQLGLPVVELARELAPQLEAAVDHVADQAQRRGRRWSRA